MLRKKSKAVLEGDCLIPQDAYVILRGIILEELQRVISETMGKALEEFKEDMRRANQRLANLGQNARHPHLAIMEADVTADKNTRERTEDAAAVVQAKHGDSYSAKRVQAGSTSSVSA